MTNDNAKPTVITAAEFVAGGYAERIAAGECVAHYDTDYEIVKVADPSEPGVPEGMTLFHYRSGSKSSTLAFLNEARFTVHWLPVAASSPDADEVARLRAALKSIIAVVAPAERFERKIYDASPDLDVYTDVLRIARAALETGEAGE